MRRTRREARSVVWLLMGAALAVGAPAWARQEAPPTTEDPARPQVETFEMVLQNAVDRGGQKFVLQASQLYPSVIWEPGYTPVVTGVKAHQVGLFLFQIQVPNLNRTSLVAARLYGGMRPPRSAPASGPVEPVAQSGNAARAPSPSAAQAGPDGSLPAEGPDVDVNRIYSDDVRAAIIDALLDSSGVLPIGADESLVIIAGGDESSEPALYQQQDHKLVLSIKGSDLIDFHANKISRDEAKARIKEEHF